MTDPLKPYGPNNPHPLSVVRTELVWEGKYDEYGNRRSIDTLGLAMPIQKIETIDEPRARLEAQGGLFDSHRAHVDDFTNRLVWGDNKLILSSLLEEFRGALTTVYCDPPFDVGADFAMDVAIGDQRESVYKAQSALEMVAYRDTWGKGTDSYVQMMYERLVLIRELLSERGTMYLHCDYRVAALLRLVLDEVFGRQNYRGTVIWKRSDAHSDVGQGAKHYGRVYDSIFQYSKTDAYKFNVQYSPLSDETVKTWYKNIEEGSGRRFSIGDLTGPGGERKGNPRYEFLGVTRYWRYSKERMQKLYEDGRILQRKAGNVPVLKRYLDESKGTPLQDLWTDVPMVRGLNKAGEGTGYPTQKPEQLIERLLTTSSDEGDLVADFFAGSGTTGAVAERLGRRWIMADLGRFAVHTTRKRMIGLQRELHSADRPYRAFDVLNLGRYERQWWQRERLAGADDEHRRIVLEFFRAESLPNSPSALLHGRKGGAFCHVDGIDSIFTRDEASEVAKAAAEAGAREVICLSWEFEMDLRLECNRLEKDLGITIKLITIPREIMEKNRTEPPPFLEVATLTAEPVFDDEGGGKVIDVKLTSFIPSLAEVPTKELAALKERAIKSGFDFIDFWAVDFDYRNGGPFHHDWQDFRLRRDRSLKLQSEQRYVYDEPGTYTACVKVVDIFGCDTSISVRVDYA